MAQTDRIFSQKKPAIGEFSFDENVAVVFDDMVARSVPLYSDVQRAVPKLVGMLAHDPIRVVDLGCSTGTSLIHLAQALPHRHLELIGVDNSAAMLDKCNQKIQALGLESKIKVENSDIESFDLQAESISAILMNYTLQFIEPEGRSSILHRLCKQLAPDGMLILSEKVIHHDTFFDEELTELYFDFKRRMGYSELEIARKREALENVLIPFSVEENIELLRNAGFKRIEVLLKWFNFATLVAYK
ncbi:MAG: carboxy-S-adenosyl-L-methionine synthase CmoA [Planctomycetota bacterium]